MVFLNNLAIHNKYYRQPLGSVETSEIAKLMYMVDHGKMQHANGMNLESIERFLSGEELFKGVAETDYAVLHHLNI